MTLLQYIFILTCGGVLGWLAGMGMGSIISKSLIFRTTRGTLHAKGIRAVVYGSIFFLVYTFSGYLFLTTISGWWGVFSMHTFLYGLLFFLGFREGVARYHLFNNGKKFLYFVLIYIVFCTILLWVNRILGNDQVVERELQLREEMSALQEEFIDVYDLVISCPFSSKINCFALRSQRAYELQKLGFSNTSWYFIAPCDRPSGRYICKMFLSGAINVEFVDTMGEKRVYEMLMGRQKSLTNNFRMNEIYSNTRYLFDLYSEAEIIVPYKTADGYGAVVEVYGD